MFPIFADRTTGYIKGIAYDKNKMDFFVGSHKDKDSYEKAQHYLRLVIVDDTEFKLCKDILSA